MSLCRLPIVASHEPDQFTFPTPIDLEVRLRGFILLAIRATACQWE
jgi:hypothetical protein